MECCSKFKTILRKELQQGAIPPKLFELINLFYDEYGKAVNVTDQHYSHLFIQLLDLIKEQLSSPYHFPPFHRTIRTPFDYYLFGNAFIEPLIDKNHSHILGREYIEEIISHLKKGANIIFFANHQTEADPQAISLLLDPLYPGFAESMIFVAGERVITDPLAAPFSMGRNLLCIYSKRYINHPAEKKEEKQQHNQKTMELMCNLLKKGKQCIYVAPSGGRDRLNSVGEMELAPFDPKSIEMFHLMARKARTTTLFYPMALSTYHILPPPETIQIELGERRQAKKGAVAIYVGPQLSYSQIKDCNDKKMERNSRSIYAWEQVRKGYEALLQLKLS